MSNPDVTNSSAFLRSTRLFPQEVKQLSVEVDRAYIDLANSVNAKTNGLFATSKPTVTGESWYINGTRQQQGFRQVYNITGAGNIPHHLDLTKIGPFVRIYGTFTDGSVWYPLPYVDVVNANNQVSVKVTSTNIVITAGAGSPPSISSGTVVIEWIALG